PKRKINKDKHAPADRAHGRNRNGNRQGVPAEHEQLRAAGEPMAVHPCRFPESGQLPRDDAPRDGGADDPSDTAASGTALIRRHGLKMLNNAMYGNGMLPLTPCEQKNASPCDKRRENKHDTPSVKGKATCQ